MVGRWLRGGRPTGLRRRARFAHLNKVEAFAWDLEIYGHCSSTWEMR
jgi:hypothetical protein